MHVTNMMETSWLASVEVDSVRLDAQVRTHKNCTLASNPNTQISFVCWLPK